MKPRVAKNLFVLTVSGAHATGKTTLLTDLSAALKGGGCPTYLTPSCSTFLFEQISKGKGLPAGSAVPSTYDEINEFGLRQHFQMQLPDALAHVVEASTITARDGDFSVSPTVFLLVDRWFPDIYAYTVMESPDTDLYARVADKCNLRRDGLIAWLKTQYETVEVLNVFVPLASVLFNVPLDDGKFRATCNREMWEHICEVQWRRTAGECRHYRIRSSDRVERVDELLSRIEMLTRAWK